MLKNGYDEYETEYGPAVGIHDLYGLHNAIGLHLVSNKAALSGAEVRFLRKELEWTQVELAKYLGVCESSVRAYERGTTIITPPADRVLRAIYLESVQGESKIQNLIEHLVNISQEISLSLELEETADGWQQAA